MKSLTARPQNIHASTACCRLVLVHAVRPDSLVNGASDALIIVKAWVSCVLSLMVFIIEVDKDVKQTTVKFKKITSSPNFIFSGYPMTHH